MTTNNIQVFSNSQFGEIRVSVNENNTPMFCLTDVCRVLGLRNASQAKQRLNEEGITTIYTLTQKGEQQLLYINEPNLYRCVFQSKKKEAAKFQDWVFGEVLPSIRKTGGYMVTKADDTPEEIMARALLVAQSTLENQKKRLAEQDMTIERQEHRIQEQTKQIEAAAPKVNYYDETLMSIDTMTMTQAANSIGMTVHTLTAKLRNAGLIFRQSGQWMLKAPYCKWGLHKTRTSTFTHANGTIGTSMYMVWTQKGLRLINEMLTTNFNLSQAVANIRKETQAAQQSAPAQTVPVIQTIQVATC